MKTFPAVIRLYQILLCVISCGFVCLPVFGESEGQPRARTNSQAQIERVMPDGRVLTVGRAQSNEEGRAAIVLGEDTFSCPLPEGRSIFIIKMESVAQLDRFTFVNENASAAGHLKIAVSNDQLPVGSTKWVDVDGQVNFSRKRFFNLSLLGVEARYVKLSFEVTDGGQTAALGLPAHTWGAFVQESAVARF